MFEVNKTRSSGYKLVDKGLGLWSLHAPEGNFTGTLKQVCFFAVRKYDFEMKELELGVMEMDKHWHNAAEYGIFKRFMWSFDTNENTSNKTN